MGPPFLEAQALLLLPQDLPFPPSYLSVELRNHYVFSYLTVQLQDPFDVQFIIHLGVLDTLESATMGHSAIARAPDASKQEKNVGVEAPAATARTVADDNGVLEGEEGDLIDYKTLTWWYGSSRGDMIMAGY